eukprot:Blabericola_migrator_1__9459@NODE_512_length_7937_cov_88_036722_g393_i0_p1_GENE_NODE_512_length_7937_cov_88_036722_g393_i0NODE_512_length_7937_cov_88_036722_g393_i0_p1_ORF_typecomplete_len826_score173_08SNAP/PF14938_6/4_9e03SNAP/PF14938_6/0_00089FliD_C/PF07195_12/66FliD_C/PF07195_12/0_28Rho_Binding/PF08912_11/0_17TPR_21/PF09976_9/7_8e03TPR_21/PF09976_9/0_049TPR_16/PF13432_6/0_53TPR_19/PF14559_6/2_4TPR_6/PF13174_6/1_8e03TPR_6/PF13174_6/2_3_NODE_512_length_7937_cov_88_036722_g393_i042696746
MNSKYSAFLVENERKRKRNQTNHTSWLLIEGLVAVVGNGIAETTVPSATANLPSKASSRKPVSLQMILNPDPLQKRSAQTRKAQTSAGPKLQLGFNVKEDLPLLKIPTPTQLTEKTVTVFPTHEPDPQQLEGAIEILDFTDDIKSDYLTDVFLKARTQGSEFSALVPGHIQDDDKLQAITVRLALYNAIKSQQYDALPLFVQERIQARQPGERVDLDELYSLWEQTEEFPLFKCNEEKPPTRLLDLYGMTWNELLRACERKKNPLRVAIKLQNDDTSRIETLLLDLVYTLKSTTMTGTENLSKEQAASLERVNEFVEDYHFGNVVLKLLLLHIYEPERLPPSFNLDAILKDPSTANTPEFQNLAIPQKVHVAYQNLLPALRQSQLFYEQLQPYQSVINDAMKSALLSTSSANAVKAFYHDVFVAPQSPEILYKALNHFQNLVMTSQFAATVLGLWALNKLPQKRELPKRSGDDVSIQTLSQDVADAIQVFDPCVGNFKIANLVKAGVERGPLSDRSLDVLVLTLNRQNVNGQGVFQSETVRKLNKLFKSFDKEDETAAINALNTIRPSEFGATTACFVTHMTSKDPKFFLLKTLQTALDTAAMSGSAITNTRAAAADYKDAIAYLRLAEWLARSPTAAQMTKSDITRYKQAKSFVETGKLEKALQLYAKVGDKALSAKAKLSQEETMIQEAINKLITAYSNLRKELETRTRAEQSGGNKAARSKGESSLNKQPVSEVRKTAVSESQGSVGRQRLSLSSKQRSDLGARRDISLGQKRAPRSSSVKGRDIVTDLTEKQSLKLGRGSVRAVPRSSGSGPPPRLPFQQH